MALLLVVTAHAHDSMLVLRGLVLQADRALELQSGALIRHDQAAQHTSTAASERGPSSAASAHIVLLSIAVLTMVEALIAAAVECSLSASLQTAPQQHRTSVKRAQCSARAYSLHVPPLLRPSGVHSSIV